MRGLDGVANAQHLEAGTQRQIEWADGNCSISAFSGTQKTCGLAISDTEPR
jgi:hypothetical protein